MARTLIRNATSQILPLPPGLGGLLVKPMQGITSSETVATIVALMGGDEFVRGVWDLVAVADANPDAAPRTSTSPTTTRGDLIVRGASADVRLAVGSSGQLLGSDGTDPAWVTPPASSPTTTRGDLIRRGASADERLALGTAGAAILSDGTDAVWGYVARPPTHVPLCGLATVDGSQGTVSVGGVPGEVDPANYAVTGRTLAWTLRVTGQVTSGDTLTVVLRNLTDGTDAATISVTATTPTNHSAAATIAASKVYELRASVSGGTTGDIGTIYGAALRASWS